MKKRVTVKRKHRYTKEADILYQGITEYEKNADGIKLRYEEKNKEAQVMVEVLAQKDQIEIRRQGETASVLRFETDKKTKGILTSPYGEIDIDLYTYRYICKDKVITLEYDILHGEEISGGYRILWDIKEE